MIKTTKWDMADYLHSEKDVIEYLKDAKIVAREENDDSYPQHAFEVAERARQRLKATKIETTDWSSDEYDFNEFEPASSKELAYA
jgi:DNA-binding phage protein